MKRFVHCIIFILAFAAILCPQKSNANHQADSILRQLNSLPKDTNKIALLNEVCKLYGAKQLERSIHYGKEALALSISIDYPAGMIQAHRCMGKSYQEAFDYKNAIDHFSLMSFLSEKFSHDLSYAESLLKIGRLYGYLGRYKKGLDYCFKSLNIYEAYEQDLDAADVANTIGTIQKNQGRPVKAEEFFRSALRIYEKYENKKGMAQGNNNIGLALQKQGQLSEALNYYQKALAINEEIGYQKWIAYNYNNIGNVYEIQGRFDEALEYHEKSLEIKQSSGDQRGINSSYLNIGNLYYRMGDYDKAIPLLEKGFNMAMDMDNVDYLIYAYETLSMVHAELGQFEQAYNYINELEQLRERIAQEEESYRLIEMEAVYENEGRKQEIELLKKDQLLQDAELQQRTYWIIFLLISIGFVSILVGIYYNNYRLKTKANQLLSLQNEEIKIQQDRIKEQQEDILDKNRMLEKSNRQLREAKEEADRASNAKAMFLSTVSHEIRTPMNAIIGMTHILLDSKHDKEQMEQLKIINFSAKTLLTLINDILDISKIDAGKIEFEEVSFNFRQLLDEIKDSFQLNASQKGLELHLDVDDSIPGYVNGDPIRLTQVLSNLIGNAVKFTNEGSITLSVSVIKLSPDKVELSFAVKDTGVGIAKEKQERIFERFMQADSGTTRHYGGTGLGLAIVKQLVELQNGKIELESEEGKGSTFIFQLGFKINSSEDATDQESSFTASEKLKGKSVLVVEDNIVNQKVAQAFLEKWGIEVDLAISGEEALKKLESNIYDLILMDIQMPILDGYETTKRIRKMEGDKRRTPVVALTASTLLDTRDEVFASGMDDFVTKPFAPEELFSKLEKAMAD